MPVDIHNKDFQNWIKAVLALNITRDVMLGSLRENLGSFILNYEKSDIQTFANCLESNHIIELKTNNQSGKRRGKVEKQTYTCEHKRCEELFDVFVDKHKGIKKENFKWDLKINDEHTDEENRVEKNTNEHEINEENTNEENRVGENTNKHEITEENAYEESTVGENTNVHEITEENTNEEYRVGENTNEHEITEENANEENTVGENTNLHEITEENTNEENRDGENTNEFELTEGKTEFLWPISRLYMFDEGEHVAKYKGLDDLDISNLIKIMTSCAICEVDGDLELYKKVSTFRNEIMHSPDNRITTQYLQEKLEEASSLIQHLSTYDQATHISHRLEDAVQYLKNLGENEFQFSFSFEEYQRVFQEAKQIIEDMVTREKPNQEGLKQLKELFKTNTLREPTDISKKLVGKPRDFKVLVQNCIKNKREALELDIVLRSQEENADHEIEQLQNLQREIEQDWNDINEELKKTEEEDLTNLLKCLRDENTTLKTERDRAVLNSKKNESLRRDIRDLERKEKRKKTEEEDPVNLFEYFPRGNLKTERDKVFQNNAGVSEKSESLRLDIRDLESKEKRKKTEEEDPVNLFDNFWRYNLKTERDKAFQDNADVNRKSESLRRDFRDLESKEKRKETEEEDPVNLFDNFWRYNLKTERDKTFQNNADVNRKSESLRRDFRDLESKEKRKKTEEEDPVNLFDNVWRYKLKTERDKAFQNNADVNRKSESLRRDFRNLESKRMEDFKSFLHNTRKDEENILANNQLMSEKENEEELRKRDAIADQKLKESQDLMSKELEKLKLDNEEYVRRITEEQRQKEEANTKMHMNAILEARSKEQAFFEELRRQHERFQAESQHGIFVKAWDFFFGT